MSNGCSKCEHLNPCIDGAFDWDDCEHPNHHDIQRERRKECPDFELKERLMWNQIAQEASK